LAAFIMRSCNGRKLGAMKCVAVYEDNGPVATGLAANLAEVMATSATRRVLLWEFDEGRSAADRLGAPMTQDTQARRLFARAADFTSRVQTTDIAQLDVIPALSTWRHLDEHPDGYAQLSTGLRDWGGTYDVVVVDCPMHDSDLNDEIFEIVDVIVASTGAGELIKVVGQPSDRRHFEAAALSTLPVSPARATRHERRSRRYASINEPLAHNGPGVTDDASSPAGSCRVPYTALWRAIERALQLTP